MDVDELIVEIERKHKTLQAENERLSTELASVKKDYAELQQHNRETIDEFGKVVSKTKEFISTITKIAKEFEVAE